MRTDRVVFVAALLQLFIWANAESQPLHKIRIGYPSISSRQGQLWVAKDEGIFRKYGLDVELIFLRGGQVAIQALTGGDPQAKSAKPAQFVDLSFLQELEAEKFFDEMARRYK
jgi:ABC-type nitrate/sulfonate/bicarbonate transport system substrate-binding protein